MILKKVISKKKYLYLEYFVKIWMLFKNIFYWTLNPYFGWKNFKNLIARWEKKVL